MGTVEAGTPSLAGWDATVDAGGPQLGGHGADGGRSLRGRSGLS